MLATCALAALTCAVLAVSLDTHALTQWLTHPGQSRRELTQQGAVFLQVMFGVTAGMLVIVPLALVRISQHGSTAMSVRTRSRKRQGWWLLCIIVLAFGMRLLRLNESLWYDELASWMTYTGGANTIGAIIGNFLDPINHPLHTLLNHLSVMWFTDALGVEIAFRLPALVFSLASVAAMFGLVCHVSGHRSAIIAALLVAILPISVLEGVEARGYSMMIFFSIMMTWLLVMAQSRRRSWIWLLYALMCALGIWSHFVTAFVPIGHGLWLAIHAVRTRTWREAASGLFALILAASISVTLYSTMIPTMLASRSMFAAVRDTQPTILGPEGWHAVLQLGGSWYWWAAIPGLAAMVLGLILCTGRKRDTAIGNELSINRIIELSLIGLPLMLIVVALSGTWMYARFTLFAWLGAVLLMTVGVSWLWDRQRTLGMIVLGAVAICSLADLAVRPPKQPLRDAADFVREHRMQEDRLLVIGLAHPVLRLYADDLNLTYTYRHGVDLAQQLLRVRPTWIIVEYPSSVSRDTYDLLARAGYERAVSFPGWVDWTNGDVLVYRYVRAREAASG